MGKVEAILAGYATIALISSLLLIFILYIILWKTPKEMKVYKWLLVNIQISVFVEVFFWTVLMAPIPHVYPITHFYSVGLLYWIFGTPVKITFAIEASLHSFVLSSFATCIQYRYRQLCAFGDHWFYRLQIKFGPSFDFSNYITGPLGILIIAYIAILPDEESRKLILKLDHKHSLFATVGAFSDLAYFWAISLLLFSPIYISLAMAVVYDSGRILRKNAAGSRSAALHKEAINALIIQISLMTAVSHFGHVILGTILATYRENTTNFWTDTFDILLSIACCFYASKSIACSLAIVAHKPYRIAIKQLFWQRRTTVAVSPAT